MKRALVICNLKAGRGRAGAAAERARDHLGRAGFVVDVEATRSHRHATELAAGLGEDRERVVVIGGDGTLREVVEGLLAVDSPADVGLVPLGAGNVVARELGIPLGARDAAAVAAGSTTRAIDVACVNGDLFLAMVGIGFDADLCARIGGIRRGVVGGLVYRLWSDLLYALFGVGILLRAREPDPLRVLVDDEPLAESPAGIVIANTRTYGKGWSAVPHADVADGRLDFAAYRSAERGALVRWVMAMKRGRVVPTLARYGGGARVEVTAPRPFRWQADGDPMEPVDRLDVTVRPAALRMVVPAATISRRGPPVVFHGKRRTS